MGHQKNNKMGYPSTLLSLLVLSISVSNIYATVAIAVPAITIPAVAISADLATTAAALGLVKLKTAAILAATRSRRSTIVENHVFEKVAELEQEKCVRRFLCEVASGQLQAPEYLQSYHTPSQSSTEPRQRALPSVKTNMYVRKLERRFSLFLDSMEHK